MATRQHGVVSHAQLREAGLSPDQIARLEWLLPLHRGVYAVGHLPRTWLGTWLAAVLACGPGAVLSHWAAAALWRLAQPMSGPVDVTLPTRSGRRSRVGISIHRSRPFAAVDATARYAIPVTTPARTILDLAATESRRRVERLIDEADRLKLCDDDALHGVLVANAGRPGAGVLAAILAHHAIGSTLTRSELEERFLRLCIDHGLPRPRVNTRVRDYLVDFLWSEARLIVEVDGRATHGTRAAFQNDRERDATLTAAGYRTLRFTYRDVTTTEAVVASRVRNVLRLALA